MPRTADLDRLIAATFGRARHVPVGRGTTALVLALRALGLTGKRVLVPASVCYAVPVGVELAGCVPVFMDADPATGNAGVLEAEAAGEAAALVCVSGLYGAPPPVAALAAWCERRGVALVEDASLSAGHEVDGRPAGGWGVCAFVSTGGGKVLDAGGGALLLTDDAALAGDLARLADDLPPHTPGLDRRLAALNSAYQQLQWEGRHRPETAPEQRRLFAEHAEVFAYAAPDGLAERVAARLATLPDELARRARTAAAYRDALPGLPTLTPEDSTALWRWSALVDDRDAVLERLWATGEDASAWYPAADRVFAPADGSLPGAGAIQARIINLWLARRSPADARRTARLLEAAA